ncbi:ATP-binding protein [Candidatus Thiosymbion oneisti]|uniref:ATP-binding protein n=1 Tax=Candidatus Thiosymbion oneisti TaxID=589554 RepID=UPI000AF09F36|nr:SbcC/MukB-like Walker B domain-containing protein [Candidatus Thiosymbion oneisti]
MKQSALAFDSDADPAVGGAVGDLFGTDPEATRSYVIEQLEVFNWGPFNGLHRIRIDPQGTAVIGQTGSGKTTLVDALMTLIAERPLYNLASTGGHESDRDLMSYIRGVSGEGNESGDNAHIARQGATVTALSARFGDGRQPVTLGALLWLDGTSSAMHDLRRLWLFSRDGALGVGDWLPVLRAGGARALKQFLRDQGSSPHDTKSAYLAQIQRFFEVGRNAFALLNRAAGLKQLNSVDQLFRELVLEDKSAYKRAEEVVAGFDVLTDIHRELEIARSQQRSLLPIETEERTRRRKVAEVERLSDLQRILPVWFATHACRLWQQRHAAISTEITALQDRTLELEQEEQRLQDQEDDLHRIYIEAGGGNLEQIERLIANQQGIVQLCENTVADYQRLIAGQGLDPELSAGTLHRNQERARRMRAEQGPLLEQLEQHRDEQSGAALNARNAVRTLEQELDQAKEHAHSNLPGNYLGFKRDLAAALGVPVGDLAYVAELVEVKPEEQTWRGAIERALGGQRLRLIVPGERMAAALAWVNQRHNRLHVRLLDAAQHRGPARFFDDGFTHKLNFAGHPLCEALKGFLAEHDLHCVADTDQLQRTAHALTMQGTISGRRGRFDKQDQRALDQGWMTGFDNRDRVRQLAGELEQARDQVRIQAAAFDRAKQEHETLRQQLVLLERLDELDFAAIDIESARAELERLQAQLRALQDPESETFRARQAWEQARQRLQRQRGELRTQRETIGSLKANLARADERLSSARNRRGSGLNDEQTALGDGYLKRPDAEAIERLDDLEREAATRLQREFETAGTGLAGSENKLIRLMNQAQREDTGALAEVGTELRDVPNYLQRLEVLTKEALPEKLDRFLGYLNKSSDEGVTQLLAHIDNEVSIIEERIAGLNETLIQVDFQPGRYLHLEPRKVIHQALTDVYRAQKVLRSAALQDDQGESHYRALVELVRQLRDAVERRKTAGARALLDPRYRLQFFVKIIERDGRHVIETRTGSQGGSGGEKEIIASYILTASLSYALCPDDLGRPLFGTVVLDEAFSKSSQAVAARIIEALRQFGLHPLFITPNKEMRLLRMHTRSAVLVHRRGQQAVTASLSWEELDRQAHQRLQGEDT